MMKWNLKPFSVAKTLAATLAVVTMCTTPLAQGAQAKERAEQTQKELINHYLRTTGLTTKKLTAGQYWRMVRPVYPAKFQKYMDAWIVQNRDVPMPQIDATTIKGRDGEQVRLLFTAKDGSTIAATFTGDMSQLVKINGVAVSNKELMDTNNFESLLRKLAKSDASLKKMIQVQPPKRDKSVSPVMSVADFRSLTARQKAEYLVRLRLIAESSERVFKAHYGLNAYQEFQKKHEYALRILFGTEAEAAKNTAGTAAGQPCIAAGYLTVYGENGSCGGNSTGWADLQKNMSQMKASCSGGGLACNPMVYGFKPEGGAYCMSRADAKYATKKCNGMSQLDRDANGNKLDERQTAMNKKRIIETYMKQVKGQDINLVVDDKNHISMEQYEQVKGFFDDLSSYIGAAEAKCGQVPLSETQQARNDQASACQEISIRRLALEAFPVAPQPDLGGKNCEEEKPGSVQVDGGGCECPQDALQENKDGQTVCTFMDQNEGPVEKKEKKKSNLLPILAILGVVGVGAFLIFKNKKGDKNPPTHVTPNPPLEPTPSPSPTVTPPPTNCEAPNTIVNGVCTPPVIVQPDTEGGTKTPVTDIGGGVRMKATQ
ncbi:hypothetical protein AZI86_13800 [Bdellovibrio bacteriovorus]|uniref:Uncharacterized protein n=1 Tax=Bdellovibrio bacteriovorus TaxID=959 RepID=A0A150WJJ7_BDEBC|nr:hypothetical protein [Bdellovibrio bacteriovorus]KYG63886.1 hypothetical protein AZI86_13800 [Bdellovibrio bacteriovorus]